MTTIKIEVEDDMARHIEESARREQKSVSEWVKERVRAEADRAAILAALEARAVANGYPPNWLQLYGSLADNESFVAPARAAGGTLGTNNPRRIRARTASDSRGLDGTMSRPEEPQNHWHQVWPGLAGSGVLDALRKGGV